MTSTRVRVDASPSVCFPTWNLMTGIYLEIGPWKFSPVSGPTRQLVKAQSMRRRSPAGSLHHVGEEPTLRWAKQPRESSTWLNRRGFGVRWADQADDKLYPVLPAACAGASSISRDNVKMDSLPPESQRKPEALAENRRRYSASSPILFALFVVLMATV